MTKNECFIELDHVTKLYGNHHVRALDDLSLSFARGEFVALTGPSGCGKSTLLHLIGGIDRPTSGRVSLDGLELSSLNDDRLTTVRANKIGFVFQFFNLLPTLTVEENVSLPLELVSKRSEQERKQMVSSVLERVGMTHRAQFFPAQLSGGEMQRTAIARAVVHSPLLLLADEPTGNLDTENGNIVLEMLESLNRSLGVTVVLATHSSRAASIARRVIQLRDGAVVNETMPCRP